MGIMHAPEMLQHPQLQTNKYGVVHLKKLVLSRFHCKDLGCSYYFDFYMSCFSATTKVDCVQCVDLYQIGGIRPTFVVWLAGECMWDTATNGAISSRTLSCSVSGFPLFVTPHPVRFLSHRL